MRRCLTAWLDRFESPSGMLTTSEQIQVDRLRQTRERWLDAVAQLAVVDRHRRQLTATAHRLNAQAHDAVLAGRDNLGLAALSRLQRVRRQEAALAQTSTELATRAAALKRQFEAQADQLDRFRRVKPLIQAGWESERRTARS